MIRKQGFGYPTSSTRIAFGGRITHVPSSLAVPAAGHADQNQPTGFLNCESREPQVWLRPTAAYDSELFEPEQVELPVGDSGPGETIGTGFQL